MSIRSARALVLCGRVVYAAYMGLAFGIVAMFLRAFFALFEGRQLTPETRQVFPVVSFCVVAALIVVVFSTLVESMTRRGFVNEQALAAQARTASWATLLHPVRLLLFLDAVRPS